MTISIEIDFREIRPYDGEKRKGFEELVCQLARRDQPQNASEFRRVEGSGGDGGVEAYWLLKDETEHGYQAKYFLATKEIDWSQIDKSVQTALKQHPKLTRYVIAIACDLTDRSGQAGRGKTGWEHWKTHKLKWERLAETRRMIVDFIPWTKSDLADRLIKSPEHRGLCLYWFNKELFDEGWFHDRFERARADLAERFQPKDHVEVSLKRAFEGLARSPAYLNFLSKWFCGVPDPGRFSSGLRKLMSPPDRTLIQNLEELCAELHRIGQSVYTFGMEPFPLADWQDTIKVTFQVLSQLKERLRHPDSEGQGIAKKVIRQAQNCLNDIGSYLDRTPIHLRDNSHEVRIEADWRHVLIVVGEAGSGKSHLFADVVASSLSKKIPAILFLGQHLPGQDLRREILSCLDLANQDFSQVLQALNAAGEVAQHRLVILIDALNESPTLRGWPEQLAGLLRDILRYKWLAIGMSLRPEYKGLLIPEGVRSDAVSVTCRGIQSREEQEQAAVQYFEKRGITRPAVPWLTPEFSNFLFLKTCCEALQELGIKEFPRGLHGSLQVLKFYLDSIDGKLRRRFPDVEIPQGAIPTAIRRIARSMATAKADYIGHKLAADTCESEFDSRGPDSKANWFAVLKSEGVFRQDHIFDDKNDDPFAEIEEVYRFTYQHFSDHLIVQALLEEIDNIDQAFYNDGRLSFLFDEENSGNWRSLWSALAIQVPEKFPGTELLDVLPEELRKSPYYYLLFEAFEQSILWRSSSAFSSRTLELFNQLPTEWSDSRLDILIRLATLRDHPWNAELLDRNLQRLSLPERDAFWTVQINYISSDDPHPLWELIRWSLTADLAPAETETLGLATTTLAWTLTSSNRPLRDSATKALISLFVNRPQLIPVVLERFQDVDDLYVMERICAALLGAITREMKHEDMEPALLAVYRAVFARETPPFNINLRDYARAIVEYALDRGCLSDSIDITKCRPPYRSEWPLSDITKEEVEKIAEKSGGKAILLSVLSWGDFARYEVTPKVHKFTSVPLGQPRPLNEEERESAFLEELSSWETEKQKAFVRLKEAVDEKNASYRIEIGSGEKFSFGSSYPRDKVERVKESEERFLSLLGGKERELYEQLMCPVLQPDKVVYHQRRLPQFDEDFAQKWVAKRAYGYGWNAKLFSADHGPYDVSSDRSQVERIGKKYEWLALSEFMARLSDNVWAIERWPERATVYDHPANDWFVRDVEPSILTDPKPSKSEEYWWQKLLLELAPIEDNRLRTWPFEEEPPYSSEWLDVIAPDETPWLLLYGFFSGKEGREEKDVSSIGFRRNVFVRITTILVESKAVESTMAKLKDRRLADPTGHDAIDWIDGPFLCEYPWRNTWQADRGLYEEDSIGAFSGIRYIRPVAHYRWEGHLDISLQNGSSVYIPNPWMSSKLDLRPDLSDVGRFVSEVDSRAVFIDPTIGTSDSSAALIDKARFLDFLGRENLECLWIIAGERNAQPSGKLGDYSCRSFAGVYRWTKRQWTGDKWYKDEGRQKI